MRSTFDKDYLYAYESQEDKDKHLYQNAEQPEHRNKCKKEQEVAYGTRGM